MGEKLVLVSQEEMNCGVYPMCFGVSCAFVALHLLSRTRGPDVEHGRHSYIGELMLQGSAQLLGLLVWRAQREGEAFEGKLKKAELEAAELKKRRIEDAKANEKVVGIFASHEQSWIAERKRLRHHIQALLSELHTLRTKNEEAILDSNKRVEEKELVIGIKDEALEEEVKKRKELEEKLQLAEEVAEELRERAKKEAQDHSAELWKHKTALVELVSNQRQLEAETGRALRQVEVAKEELDEMFEQKEEAVAIVEKLSEDMVKLQRDAEQKDKILSAMLRKSKLDTAEKQMLLKEVKISKARKKQAELEMERWRNMWESRHKKSSRGLHSVEAGCSKERREELQRNNSGFNPKTLLLEYLEAENRKERESVTPKGENIISTFKCLDQYSSEGNDELEITDDIQQLQDWVRLETEKYATILEQRHLEEIEAFTEQMRLKDDNLEAFRWRLLSTELESKRLQSHIEGLDGSLFHFREENIKLEALLLDREKELKFLKEQFSFHFQHCRKNNSYYSSSSAACDPQALRSEAKITRRKSKEKEQETKANLVRDSQKVEDDIRDRDDLKAIEEAKLMHFESQNTTDGKYRENMANDITEASSPDLTQSCNRFQDRAIIPFNQHSEELVRTESPSEDKRQDIILMTLASEEEIEEEKEVSMDPGNLSPQNNFQEDASFAKKLVLVGQGILRKDSSWKMDIHALGVSYKIKRLKQQLLVVEKLAGAQAVKQLATKDDSVHASDGSNKRKVDDHRQEIKGFLLVMSLLNKQVKRYQSLEEKTDDLCRRMHENYLAGSSRDSRVGRTKEQIEALERFLEETFQVQRYMVATGQKLMEIQSRITCSFVSNDEGLGESAGFNMSQFADVVRTLFRDIQRGLEVRISRIIGDLEGTLACDGILHR